MFKKSMVLVSIIILSCIYILSCKSSNRSGSTLTELPIITPGEIANYVKAVRVVAASRKCDTDNNKGLIMLGNGGTDEASYTLGSNFISTKSDTDVTISLFKECFDYVVTLAYFCEANTELGIKKEQLCFKGTASTEGKQPVNNVLQLTISLKAQGDWKGKLGKNTIETPTPETSVTLASFFDAKCFIKNNDTYDFYMINDKLYPLFSKECTYKSTKNTEFSSTMGIDYFQSPFSDKSQFDSDKTNLLKGNNIIEILEIDGKSKNISSIEELSNVLNTNIASGFKINIIPIPDEFVEGAGTIQIENVVYTKNKK